MARMAQTARVVLEPLAVLVVRQLPVAPAASRMAVDLSDGTTRQELLVIHLHEAILLFLEVQAVPVAPEAMVVMVARVRQLVPVEPEVRREQAAPVQLEELSMAVDLPDTTLEPLRRFIQLGQFRSPVLPVVLVAMEVMAEREVMEERRVPVE